MIRFRLNSCFNTARFEKNWSFYKTQRRFCSNLSRKAEKDYFSKINPKLVLPRKTTTSLPENIESFKDHPSIKNVFYLRGEKSLFECNSGSANDARKVILNMDEERQT